MREFILYKHPYHHEGVNAAPPYPNYHASVHEIQILKIQSIPLDIKAIQPHCTTTSTLYRCIIQQHQRYTGTLHHNINATQTHNVPQHQSYTGTLYHNIDTIQTHYTTTSTLHRHTAPQHQRYTDTQCTTTSTLYSHTAPQYQ